MDMPTAQAREAALQGNLMTAERRSSERVSCGGQGATLFVRGRPHAAQVLNISVQGAMLESAARPILDDQVVVAFDGCTPVHASVRWVRNGHIGLHFGRELLLA